MDLVSSMFFNEGGVFAETERLALRAPLDADMGKYVDAFGEANPGLANWYRLNEEAMPGYWECVKDENSLYCSICARTNGSFLGYCSVEDLASSPFELGINLLGDCQARGVGPEAMRAFMLGLEEVVGPTGFVAKIEVANGNSQRMFRRLGFKPAGIEAFLTEDPQVQRSLEEARLSSIDEAICALAEEFGVEPRTLLSHVLVFEKEPIP